MADEKKDSHKATLSSLNAGASSARSHPFQAVERVLGDLFWHQGKIAEPYPCTEEVALAAIDSVYSFHKKNYSRHAASPKGVTT